MGQNLIQIAENVWLWPPHPDPERVQPSIGVVIGDLETILVDAGNSPSVAIQLKEALNREDFPPVGQIVYTHHHWDHISGACEFDVPVVAHVSCHWMLLEEAKKPWSSEFLKEVVRKNPKLQVSCEARERAIQDWENFRIVVPEIVFERSEGMDLGKISVILEHVGGDHAEDSIIVKVPQAGVMFLGDCFYPPPLHLREPDSTFSIPMLASLEDEAYSLYIDSHSEPYTREELLEFLEEEQSDRSMASE